MSFTDNKSNLTGTLNDHKSHEHNQNPWKRDRMQITPKSYVVTSNGRKESPFVKYKLFSLRFVCLFIPNNKRETKHIDRQMTH